MGFATDQYTDRSFAFGRWLLRGDGLLVLDGKEIHLPPKELHVLRLLLGAAGSLVSRAWLLDQIWPNCNVAEESLTRCIYVLRKLLGSDNDYIKAVYGKGYRFVGLVVEREEISPTISPGLVSSLLVLPLRVRGDDCLEGLRREITRQLASAFGATLCVMPAGLHSTGDCLSLVERLVPDYYLSIGGVVNEGRFELSVELCCGCDHALLHSQSLVATYDREVVLDGLISLVAQRLPGLHPVALPCGSYPVALSYMNGLLALQAYTNHSLSEALIEFLHCVNLDASYAPPWCGLADVYLAMATVGLLAQDKALAQAQRAVARALALEPGSAAATMRLALLSGLQGAIDAAEALFRPMLLTGDRAEARFFYAWHQWCLGFHEQALKSIEMSLAEDTASVTAHLMRARIALELDPQRGLEAIRAAIRVIGTGHEQMDAMYALILDACGDSAAALAVVERAGLQEVKVGEAALIACYVRAASSPDEARRAYERWCAESKHPSMCPAQLPVLRRLEGDLYAAQRWRELASQAPPWLRARLGDPRLWGLSELMSRRLQA